MIGAVCYSKAVVGVVEGERRSRHVQFRDREWQSVNVCLAMVVVGCWLDVGASIRGPTRAERLFYAVD